MDFKEDTNRNEYQRDIKMLNINLLEHKTPEENEFGIHGVMRQLYDFYFVKGNSRDVNYHITCNDVVTLNEYLYDNTDAYERFGIYVKDGIVSDLQYRLECIPNDVFSNKDVSVIKDYMLKLRKEALDKGFTDVEFIIQVPLYEQRSIIGSNIGQLDSYVDLLNEFNFINLDYSLLSQKNVVSSLKKMPVYKDKTLVNMLSLMVKSGCLAQGIGACSTVYRQNTLIQECIKMYNENKNIVFYYDETDASALAGLTANNVLSLNSVEKYVYTSIAAYLTVHGVPCHVNRIYFRTFEAAVCEYNTGKNTYLSDRIAQLRNPLRMGVLNSIENGNFKSIAQLIGDINLTFQIRFIALEDTSPGKHLTLSDSEYREINFDYRDINIRDIRDFYDLHTMDYAKALEELQALDGLLTNAWEILEIKDRALDCSNTLVFEFEGGLKLGYLTQLKYSAKYRLTPLARGYSIKNEIYLDEEALGSLVDIRAYSDYRAICGTALARDPDLLARQLPNTSIGFLITGAHKSAENITEASGIPFDAIALHSKVTSLLRGDNINVLVKCGLPIKGLQKNFLTYFGGPVPYHGESPLDKKAKLDIGPNIWR